MKKLFSHGALFVVLLLAPMSVFGKKMNTYSHHRAGQSAHETRYERNCLASFEAEFMGGQAKKGYNSAKNKVNALEIYEPTSMGALATGAVGNPAADAAHGDLLTALIGFGTGRGTSVHFNGKFTMFEANLNYTQNFCKGFFLDINVPIKKLKISNISLVDLTSNAFRDELMPNAEDGFARILADVDSFLNLYENLDAGEASSKGVGDIMVAGGWTSNNDDIDNLDFLDTTIKVGVSIPTAKKRNQDKVFELALGHEGHVGLATSFDLGVGFYEWMTLGAHVGGLFFFDKTINMRMQTSALQAGWLKLKKGNAKVDMGNIWDAGGYLKADHIFKGVSLMFGYNYVHKGNDVLTPENTTLFPVLAANADNMLKGYTQHAVTVTLEYDMAEEGRRWNPHFSVFYTRPVKGKYIFITDVGGGTAGVNVAWDY
jgi:hypothetical protein